MNNEDRIIKEITHKFIGTYWKQLWKEVEQHPELKNTIPGFLLSPEQVVIYLGRTHLAIEYFGSETPSIETGPSGIAVVLHDYVSEEHLFDAIVGFSHDGTSGIRFPIFNVVSDIYDPTNRAMEVLQENKWDFFAQDMILNINCAGYYFPEGEGARIINSFFYDANESGLIVRHVKWLDIIPVSSIYEDDELYRLDFSWNPVKQAKLDSQVRFREPPHFQFDKLKILNRFVELFSKADVTETEITRFLATPGHQFILQMAFFGKKVFPEIQCTWADNDRKEIRPDFFVEQPNGFSDIIEFKLPSIKGSLVVGSENRETFSANLNGYISQTRTYNEYFDDPRNRDFVQNKYGIKVLHPRRYLVIGRRWMLPSTEWRSIENDYKNISIRTYDDIIDGVRSQLYS